MLQQYCYLAPGRTNVGKEPTYSLSDIEDVRRIRAVLREEAGITKKILYKTDVATTSHLYKNKEDKRISSLYE